MKTNLGRKKAYFTLQIIVILEGSHGNSSRLGLEAETNKEMLLQLPFLYSRSYLPKASIAYRGLGLPPSTSI